MQVFFYFCFDNLIVERGGFEPGCLFWTTPGEGGANLLSYKALGNATYFILDKKR